MTGPQLARTHAKTRVRAAVAALRPGDVEGVGRERPHRRKRLPVGAPRLPPGHLDAAVATRALTLLRPRAAISIHWGAANAGAPERPYVPTTGEILAAQARIVAPEAEPDVERHITAPSPAPARQVDER